MKGKKVMNFFAIFSIVIVLIFISGQEGCTSSQQGQSGINFVPIGGVSMLTPGDVLEKNEAFIVGTHIENYNDRDMEGIVCVRDDLDDAFGGIASYGEGDCQSFFVKASEKSVSQQGQSSVMPGTTNIYFPESGEYMYQGLPELNTAYQAKLFVSMKYRQDSQITGTLTSPDEQQPIMTQESQPINVFVKKSIFRRGDNYQINIEIDLMNRENVEIYSPDFGEREKIYFFAEMKPLNLQCTDVNNNPLMGLMEFRNEKIIKCFALTPSRTQQSYPLVITLDYGVSLEREYNFGIKTK